MSGASVKRRNSRWSDAPVRGRDGRPRCATITKRDIDGIFVPLARYRFLPADYLHAFVGGSLDYLINRLELLSRQPNLYVRRPLQQRANAGANHRRLIYELDDKGKFLLEERGLPCQRSRASGNFAHELMTSLVMASFEIGTRETGARFIRWSEISNSRILPDATRRSPRPFHIPASAEIGGVRIDSHIAADGEPFGVERMYAGERGHFFCPGIEADCGTEPVDTSDYTRSSITKKLALYLAVEAHGRYRTHFGFPNFYVPFITTTAARLASMMTTLDRLTAGRGSKIFLFKTFPAFTSFEKPPAPSGQMLTEDWARVGYPPFNFLTS